MAALPSTSNNFPLSSSTTSQPNVLSASTSSKVIPGTQSTSSAAPPLVTPPELESTLAMLSSHRTVLGYLLLTRPSPSSTSATSSLPSHSFASVRIIRSSGVVFEGESGKRYAGAIGRIVDTVTRGLADVVGEDGGDAVSETNEQSVNYGANFRLVCMTGRSAVHAYSDEAPRINDLSWCVLLRLCCC